MAPSRKMEKRVGWIRSGFADEGPDADPFADPVR